MLEKKNKEINLSFFWDILKPFKLYILGIFSLGVIYSGFIILKVTALKAIINYLSAREIEKAYAPIGVYLGAWFVNEICWRIRDYCSMYFKPLLKQRITNLFLSRILLYKDEYFQKNNPTAILNGLRNMFDGVEDYIFTLEELFSHFIFIVSTCVSMFFVNHYFGFTCLIWMVTWGFFAYYWSQNGYALAFAVHETRIKMNSHLGDVFANMSTVKSFNAEEYEKEKAAIQTKSVLKSEIKREKMFFKIWVVQGISFFLVLSISLFILISQYKVGKVTIGDFAMILELIQAIYLNLFEVGKDISEVSESYGRIKQGLSTVYKKISEKAHNPKLPDLEVKKGEIVFDNITYKYPDSDPDSPPLFKNNYIKIEAGSTVAIVGPSGGGKTTLIKFLLRLITPDSGKVLIDGKDISKYSIESVRSTFGIIPQELGLFKRSIEDNIKYGSFNSTREEVIAAAKQSGAHEFIKNLHNDYDAKLELECNLSGGQKQRLMIARGLLRKAKIFIFDEPTSALDLQTEADVLESIDHVTKGYTKIIVAHRLKTVEKADLILVCSKGEIVEKGTHEELTNKNGLYAKLFNLV